MRFQMLPREARPDFLDLPWQTPLAEWTSPRIVEVARGISRHVVRFVNYDGDLYALKELPTRLAERETIALPPRVGRQRPDRGRR